MRKKFIFLSILVVLMSLPLMVNADTRDCTEKKIWQGLTVKLTDQSNSSYTVGERVYVDLEKFPMPEDNVSGFIILRSTDGNDTIQAWLKDLLTPNSTKSSYFVIPESAKVGTEYEIEGYTIYFDTNEIASYGATVDGEKVPIYKSYCGTYVLDQSKVVEGENSLMNVSQKITKIKIAEGKEVRKAKSQLKSIEVDKDYSYLGGKVNYKVSLTAPAKQIMVTLYNEKAKDKISGTLEGYDKKSTNFTGYVKVPGYIATGDYVISSVHITDEDGEWIQYLKNVPDAGSPKYGVLTSNIKVTVGESISDILGKTGFTLSELTFEKDKVPVGDTLNVKTNYKWDYSIKIRIKSVLVSFADGSNNMFNAYLKNGDKELVIPTTAKEGTYKVKSVTIELESYMGETNTIIIKEANADEAAKKIFSQTLTVEKPEADVLYFNNADLNDDVMFKLKNSKQDAVIKVVATGHTIVTADLFNIIKESPRQLIIESGDNQWVFNGTDIVKSKDIDVDMKFYSLEEAEVDKTIADKVAKQSVVIDFPENGELPGTVLMRIKDTELSNVLKGNVYYIYFIDETNNKLSKVSMEVQKSSDGYVEFYMNHNSKYLILNEAVKEEAIIGEDDHTLKFNNSDSKKEETEAKKDNNSVLYIALGAACIIIVGLVCMLIGSKRNKKVEAPVETAPAEPTKEPTPEPEPTPEEPKTETEEEKKE